MGEASAFGRAILTTALCVVALSVAAPAAAQPGSLRDGLFGHREGRRMAAPPVARYVLDDGTVFVLDRTVPRPLLKFEGSPEIWSLQPQPAPRGDVIYKNDLGEPVLRATKLGGITLFTDDRPGGSAAALDGPGAPIRLPVMGPQAVLERLAQASARASRASHRLITFSADASPTSSALIADAATVVCEAVSRMTRNADGRALLARVKRVRLAEGRKAGVQLAKGSLQITVAPAQGLAGRPSSERIVAVAEKGR
jgi:hypothetical protein